ncbi:MAG TPA: hypothetical protein VFP69_19715 [Streptomyces sp.]|nr:hypothetical protein [Streptomyces sp.]
MAFGVEELRVLRRALALAVHPSPATAEDVKDCLRLAGSLDEAAREGARLRAFLVADLARYRAALPGTAVGYLAVLEEALGSGHRPGPHDLAALRALRGNPLAAALLARCESRAGDGRHVRPRLAVRRARLATHTAAPDGVAAPVPAVRTPRGEPVPPTTPAATAIPASRTRLQALPGGLADRFSASGARPAPEGEPAAEPARDRPAGEPGGKPGGKPSGPDTARPRPARPIPTPGEVFPRGKPAPPPADRPADPPRQLAAV